MKNPKLVGEIVKAVSLAIKKPVTVKIRKGFGAEDRNAVEIAKIIEGNGGAYPRSSALIVIVVTIPRQSRGPSWCEPLKAAERGR